MIESKEDKPTGQEEKKRMLSQERKPWTIPGTNMGLNTL